VFFVHGWSDWSATFRQVIEELPKQIHAIAVSLPGFGGSDPIAEPARPSDMAQAVVAVADRLGVTRAVFVGQSIGERVCQRVAELRADLVNGLVSVEAAAGHSAGRGSDWEHPARIARDVMSVVEAVTARR
jgi:pimeloyl-ACP methyl ester carboxylesterase